MSEDTFYIVPEPTHNQLVEQAYAARGFDAGEQACAARFSAHATRHGIRTHNALKALRSSCSSAARRRTTSSP